MQHFWNSWSRAEASYIVILNNSFNKKVAVPKSIYPNELPILMWWQLGRSFALKKSYSKKLTAAKNWLFWKRVRQKKQIL